jgi:hypothetical protein
MKNFKLFIEENENIPIIPEVNHGEHAKELKEKAIDESLATVKKSDWIQHNDNSHLGDDVEEVHDKINKEDNHPDADHIKNYTKGSFQLNKNLIIRAKKETPKYDEWNNYPNKETESKAIKGIDRHLSDHTLEHDLHVYHGTRAFHPGKLSGLHLKKGQKGTYIGENSYWSEEKEFLLPRKTVLKVHHTPDVLHDGTKVWHAHVV